MAAKTAQEAAELEARRAHERAEYLERDRLERERVERLSWVGRFWHSNRDDIREFAGPVLYIGLWVFLFLGIPLLASL